MTFRSRSKGVWRRGAALSYVWFSLLALAAGLGMSGCAANLATGERHLNLYGESQEITMGQQADTQVVASLGLYSSAALQRYVQELGLSLPRPLSGLISPGHFESLMTRR